jgi:hypothetical protein
MMANAPQRVGTDGIETSASGELYRKRREGNLTRQSDGFRTPYPLAQPRGYVQRGYKPDEPLEPYRPNPASLPGAPFPNVPRTWIFFRAMDLGAPRVGFPDAARTQGKLQPSGAAWGRIGEQPRSTLQPPTDGINDQPNHRMGGRIDSEFLPRSTGPRWRYPVTPKIRGVRPGASTAM